LNAEDLRHAALVIALVGFLAVSISYDHVLLQSAVSRHYGDFGKIYESARAFLTRGQMYEASVSTEIATSPSGSTGHPNLNAPHFELAFLPFALLSPAQAWRAWWVLNALCILAAAVIVLNELRWPRFSLAQYGAGAVFLLGSVLTGSLLSTGQVSAVLLLPVVFMWRELERNRLQEGAVWIGLLMAVKPFLGLLLLHPLVRRAHREIAIAIVVAAVLFALGLSVCGVAAYRSWIGALQSVNWTEFPMNASLWGFLARAFTETPTGAFEPVLVLPGRAVSAIGMLATCGILAATWFALAGRSTSNSKSLCLLLSAGLLCSPLGWIYYFWFLLPPLAGMASRGLNVFDRAAVAIFLVVSMIPQFLGDAGQPSSLASVSINSLYFLGLLAFWGLLAAGSFRSGEPTPSRVSPLPATS
jgi:hypothetical protein